MSAGIYMNNGILAYTIDLEKKLKRRKQAIIIEEYTGSAEGAELEKELQKLLDKHTKIIKTETPKEDSVLLYHWKNKSNGYTFHSIYPTLRPEMNPNEWESYQE